MNKKILLVQKFVVIKNSTTSLVLMYLFCGIEKIQAMELKSTSKNPINRTLIFYELLIIKILPAMNFFVNRIFRGALKNLYSYPSPIIPIILLSLLSSCWGCNKWIKTPGVIPTTPQNMTDANSVYDDMNSADPRLTGYTYFYFSSNRNSQGKNFDVVSADFGFEFDRKSTNYQSATSVNGSTTVNDDRFGRGDNPHKFFQMSRLLPEINTEKYNELGPYGYSKQSADLKYFKHYLLYSNDDSKNGDLNVKFAYIEGEHEYPYGDLSVPPSILSLKGNIMANLLNSGSDDAYPSIDDVNGIIYFCSNRSGKFQIYQVKYDPLKELADELQSTKNEPEIIPSLAGNANDKCPFVKSNVMVFVSDREGSLGGFDLYYSLRGTDGVWGTPVNFGSAINTSHDEYRPIIDKFDGYSNDLLIFSSNRPGGLGGYDLYYVGVPKLISQ